MWVFALVEDDVARLRHLLRAEVLVDHLLVEAEWHADHELTQLTHVVHRVLVEVPPIEHLLAHRGYSADILVKEKVYIYI